MTNNSHGMWGEITIFPAKRNGYHDILKAHTKRLQFTSTQIDFRPGKCLYCKSFKHSKWRRISSISFPQNVIKYSPNFGLDPERIHNSLGSVGDAGARHLSGSDT